MGEDDGKSDISCIAGIVFVGTFRGGASFHDSVEKKEAFRGTGGGFFRPPPAEQTVEPPDYQPHKKQERGTETSHLT